MKKIYSVLPFKTLNMSGKKISHKSADPKGKTPKSYELFLVEKKISYDCLLDFCSA